MIKTLKNNAKYVVITLFLIGAVLAIAPSNASAQAYYGGYGYTGSYGSYGMNWRHPMVRQPSNYYVPVYNPKPYYQYNSYPYNYSYQYRQPLTASCSLSAGTDAMGPYISWSTIAYGGSGPYTYSWTGTDNPTGINSSIINVYYTISGTKYMNVTVYSADGQTTTAYCGSTYFNFYPYYNNSYNNNYNYNNYNYNQYPIAPNPVIHYYY